MSMSKKTKLNKANGDRPGWVRRLLELYEAGVAHAFIVHFNTGDYVSPEATVPAATYLAQMLASRIVAIYSRDRGITFPTETMRQAAMDILGLAGGEQAADPALMALQSMGAAPAPGEQELPRSPGQALPLLDKLLRYAPPEGEEKSAPRGTAVIVEGAELIAPDGPLASMSPEDRTALAILARWGRDAEIVSAGNPVFLIANNVASLHGDLRAAGNRYESLPAPLPDTEARQRYIARYLERRACTLADGLTPETVGSATAGLSLLHVEDILLRAEATGQLTRRLIWERKEDIIRSEFGDVLEIIEPKFGFEDIGGLEHVKQFFQRSVIRPMAEGRRARVPMGVLLTGPAGTGKSIMAVAVAREAGVNAVWLRIGGQIASKWQGEGERNLEKALRAIQGLAPTIVFMDEIDQAMQRGDGSGGSQQDQRIFQRLLEFMSEGSHRGEIVFLAATNRPDLMDAALRRPGRFDKKIPFLVPDQVERDNIFQVMTRRYLGQAVEVSEESLEATQGWTGAEIEAAVVKAAEIIEDEGQEIVWAIQSAVERLSPSTADIELMTYLAIQECNDQDLLPPKYREMLADRAALDKRVEQARSGTSRGRRSL